MTFILSRSSLVAREDAAAAARTRPDLDFETGGKVEKVEKDGVSKKGMMMTLFFST